MKKDLLFTNKILSEIKLRYPLEYKRIKELLDSLSYSDVIDVLNKLFNKLKVQIN